MRKERGSPEDEQSLDGENKADDGYEGKGIVGVSRCGRKMGD